MPTIAWSRWRHDAGWLLPPAANHSGGKLPCLMMSGMDTFRGVQINASADQFLRRAFACLILDGPGQGTSLLRGICYQPDRYDEVGTAA